MCPATMLFSILVKIFDYDFNVLMMYSLPLYFSANINNKNMLKKSFG